MLFLPLLPCYSYSSSSFCFFCFCFCFCFCFFFFFFYPSCSFICILLAHESCPLPACSQPSTYETCIWNYLKLKQSQSKRQETNRLKDAHFKHPPILVPLLWAPKPASNKAQPTLNGYRSLSPMVVPTKKKRLDIGTKGTLTPWQQIATIAVQLLAVKKKTCNQTSETETHRVPICSIRLPYPLHSKQTLGAAKVLLSNPPQAIALEPVAASARHWQQQQKHPSRRPEPVADVDPARSKQQRRSGDAVFNSGTRFHVDPKKKSLSYTTFGQETLQICKISKSLAQAAGFLFNLPFAVCPSAMLSSRTVSIGSDSKE